MKKLLGLIAATTTLTLVASTTYAGATFDAIKKKGFIQCGVSQGLPGFSNPDDKGNWSGLDVDFCHAVAAAVFGDTSKVKFTPLSAKERFTALQSGEVDLLSRNTTWTITRDTALGLNFAGVDYYDGQGFMVRKDLGVKSAKELNGATVCTNTGTTTELNLADYFQSHHMKYQLVSFEKSDEVLAAYVAGRCDVYTTDRSGLAAQRIKLKNPKDNVILPDVISKEPLGPAVRQGDDQWFDIVKWSLNCMIEAEELGVTSKNVDTMLKSQSPRVRRLLGVEGDDGKGMGLDNSWCKNIISQVGNYGEMFDRNVGPDSPLGLDRGLNNLWTHGGLMYSPPFH